RGMHVQGSDLGFIPAATDLFVHSTSQERARARVCIHGILPPCVPTRASASRCPGKSFEPSQEKLLGIGSGRLQGMCVQSCQMDLCPS
ncbi:Hypothetical predicted protein, partial [Scomber scombrus]